MQWWRVIIEFIAALIMAGCVGGILFGVLKDKIAFSGRTLAFAGIACVLPGTLILSLEHIVGNEGAITIFAVVIGYALSIIRQTE